MRNIFVKILTERADKNTFLITGDLGFGIIEPFTRKYPDQFLNAGVAEQNMTGMAAGLSLAGFKVFTYSIGNFNTARCLEQIRNDICYHNLDVTVVSVGSGFMYGNQGYSHYAVQDIALMGSLPNMKILLPGDSLEAEFAMNYIFQEKGPKYLRLGRNCEKIFHKNLAEVGKISGFNGNEGPKKIALVAAGTMLETAFSVHESLEKQNIASSVFSCLVVDGDFSKNIKRELSDFDFIFVIEEHISSLGVAALIRNAFDGERKSIKSFGLERDFCKIAGDRNYLCKRHGISVDGIVDSIKKILNKNNL